METCNGNIFQKKGIDNKTMFRILLQDTITICVLIIIGKFLLVSFNILLKYTWDTRWIKNGLYS